jgi:hypothetical protein
MGRARGQDCVARGRVRGPPTHASTESSSQTPTVRNASNRGPTECGCCPDAMLALLSQVLGIGVAPRRKLPRDGCRSVGEGGNGSRGIRGPRTTEEKSPISKTIPLKKSSRISGVTSLRRRTLGGNGELVDDRRAIPNPRADTPLKKSQDFSSYLNVGRVLASTGGLGDDLRAIPNPRADTPQEVSEFLKLPQCGSAYSPRRADWATT